MKKTIAMFLLLSAMAFAEVTVSESVNPVSGIKTVSLAVPGDKSYSSTGAPAVLAIRCQGIGSHQAVSLMLSTGAVIEDGPRGRTAPAASSPMESAFSRLIEGPPVWSTIRFEENSKPEVRKWNHTEDPGTLAFGDAKFIHNKLFKSKMYTYNSRYFTEVKKSVLST